MKFSERLKKVMKRMVTSQMHGQGDYDTDTHVIRVNKIRSKKEGGRGGVIDTIVEEELHAQHPKAWEKTIKKKVSEMLKKMSQKQKQKYYSKYK